MHFGFHCFFARTTPDCVSICNLQEDKESNCLLRAQVIEASFTQDGFMDKSPHPREQVIDVDDGVLCIELAMWSWFTCKARWDLIIDFLVQAELKSLMCFAEKSSWKEHDELVIGFYF